MMIGNRRGAPFQFVLWLAFSTIVAASGFSLLRACGVLLPIAAAVPGFGWNFCPATPSVLSTEAARGAALREISARLELEIGRKQLACANIPPPPPAPLDLPTHAGESLPQQTAEIKQPSELEKRLQREGAHTGELQVSLAWEGTSDLDLHVTCPDGKTIYFSQKVNCGGTLDVDMNLAKYSMTPVENIFWPKDGAPRGHFKVAVSMYQRHDDKRPAIPFVVRVKDGAKVRTVSGQITKQELLRVMEFDR